MQRKTIQMVFEIGNDFYIIDDEVTGKPGIPVRPTLEDIPLRDIFRALNKLRRVERDWDAGRSRGFQVFTKPTVVVSSLQLGMIVTDTEEQPE